MESKIDLSHYPEEPGVYLMKDRKGGVLYVGKAKNLKARLKQYFARHGDEREMVPFLIAEIHSIDIIVLQNEKQALLLENTLIKKHQPKYNALLKDDKTFISLHINTEHAWPMVRLVRYKGKPKDKGLYFGPYPDAGAARETLDLIQRLFPLRQCSNQELMRRTRPCLLYGIKRCIAPCVELCSKKQYSHLVDSTIRFLRGQDKEILETLRKDMEKAAEHLEFERAASLLQTIRGVEAVLHSDRLMVRAAGRDTDVLAIYREGFNAVLTQLFWREGKLTGAQHYEFFKIADRESDLLASFVLQHYKKNLPKRPLHNSTSLEKTGHFDEISNSSEPAYAERPIGGERESKDREMTVFNEEDQLCRGLPKEILTSHPISSSLEEAVSELCEQNIALYHPQKGEKKQLVDIALKNAKILFEQKRHAQETNEQLLIELQETCLLTRYPQHIECFDTSNIAGSAHVACMVGFINGVRSKDKTRLFHIRRTQVGDDYGAMKEALERRLVTAKETDDLPDLIIVDGGKGQLNTARHVLQELDIASVDVIALAKESARHDKGLSHEKIFLLHKEAPVVLDKRSSLLFFLQRIRDEAHRTAIGFHRKSRAKSTLKSGLDAIPGIGPLKKKRLLAKFGSLARIQAASDDAILSVKGISLRDLQNLRNLFRNEG